MVVCGAGIDCVVCPILKGRERGVIMYVNEFGDPPDKAFCAATVARGVSYLDLEIYGDASLAAL